LKILSKNVTDRISNMQNFMVLSVLNNLDLEIKKNVLAYSSQFVKSVKEENFKENLRILLFSNSKKLMNRFQFSIFSLNYKTLEFVVIVSNSWKIYTSHPRHVQMSMVNCRMNFLFTEVFDKAVLYLWFYSIYSLMIYLTNVINMV